MTALIFQATYHKDVDVPSRNVRQIVLEIPSEQTEEALKVLGKRGSWVAVARMADPDRASARNPTESPSAAAPAADVPAPRPAGVRAKPDTSKTPWRDQKLVTRAAILCADPLFWEYMGAADATHAASKVRGTCAVASRKDLDTDVDASERYLHIEREFFAFKEDRQRFGPA
jgi:hypothetical protein